MQTDFLKPAATAETRDSKTGSAEAVVCKELLAVPSNEEKRIGFAHDRDLENGKEEWLTPPQIIKALEFTRVDGELVSWPFDLDPCAPIKRPWPTAKNHYTIEDNGLIKPWHGRVWLNAPYGDKTGHWLMRLASEHKNGTALTFARTETADIDKGAAFFVTVWPFAKAVCFLKGRLSFYHVTGKRGGTAGAPSMLIAYDDDNANALWDAVQHGRLSGCFVDLRGGNTTT